MKNKLMKKILTTVALSFVSISALQAAPAAVSANEDWKSHRPEHRFTLGASAGFGLVDTSGGVTLLPNIAAKVVPDGFIPEIVNPVFIEVQFGPLFTSGVTIWTYSANLRWDFVKDSVWTLFALGGFGGNFMDNKLGDRMAFFPRFGVGALYFVDPSLALRTDFSHEAITVGAMLAF